MITERFISDNAGSRMRTVHVLVAVDYHPPFTAACDEHPQHIS